ncbi:hypothetical protein [Escherichia coli]|uniref:hypothetical protein n=1 Tax=Escherichia coli TaxID=562 RepID=UPI003A89847F
MVDLSLCFPRTIEGNYLPRTGLAHAQSGPGAQELKIKAPATGRQNKWYKSSVAMNHFIGGKSGGSIIMYSMDWIHYDWNTHVRIGDGVDEEHVDAYCCPLIKLQHQED